MLKLLETDTEEYQIYMATNSMLEHKIQGSWRKLAWGVDAIHF